MSWWWQPFPSRTGPDAPEISEPTNHFTIAFEPYVTWNTSLAMAIQPDPLPLHFHLQFAADPYFLNLLAEFHSRDFKASTYGYGTYGSGNYGGALVPDLLTGFQFENPVNVWNPLLVTGLNYADIGADVRFLATTPEGATSVRVRVEQMV